MTNIPRLISSNTARWESAKITRSRLAEVAHVAQRLVAPNAKTSYLALENATGVPWWVIAVIHEREASQDFSRSLAQGDRWDRVSRNVPRGRGPFPSFFAAGVDALVKCAPFASRWKDWTPGGTLTLLELYNGTGYEDYHHEASPYIWGATDQEEWGKYVGDGDYQAHVWDTQIGCAALIRAMMAIDPSIQFAGPPPVDRDPHNLLWVQTVLNSLGAEIEADGVDGPQTQEAVRNFQRKNGLTVDGVAGPKTKAALMGQS